MRTQPFYNFQIPSDWKLEKLSKYGETFTGLSGKTKDDFGSGKPYIPYMNIFNNAIIKDGEFDFVKIASDEIQSTVENGDLFFTTSSETPEEVGMCSAYDGNEAELYLNSFCFGFRPNNKEKIYSPFISLLFRSAVGRRIIYKLAQGATRHNISKIALLNEDFPLPTHSEQKAIANILMSWVSSIDKTQKLILQLQERNKWLTQQLLSGKKRLKQFQHEKWKKKKLADCLTYTPREVPKPESNFFALGIRSHAKGIFHKNDFEPEDLAMDVLYEVKENDLIVNITFAWEHAIAIAGKQDDGGLVSHRFPTYTFKTENAIPDFFRYFILQKHFKYQLDLISPGGAGRNRVMSKKDFPKIEVDIPSVPEQRAIASVLNTAYKELNIQQNKLIAIKEQMKGLMQILLTGKKRITKTN